MTYVIGEPCVDVLDRGCVEECPVDCIYEGKRALYIHPDECVDCGACEPVCPVEAIYYEDDVPRQWGEYVDDNARFFAEPLPGRGEALGSPGGAAKLGIVGADTELVAGHPLPEEVNDRTGPRSTTGSSSATWTSTTATWRPRRPAIPAITSPSSLWGRVLTYKR